MTLNLHVFSAVVSEEPECRVDRDCPSQLVCIGDTCQNPCVVNNPCIGSQQCVVQDNGGSYRSVACECPAGLIYGDRGECIQGRKICRIHFPDFKCFFILGTGENECRRNEDCRQSEVCHTGTCVNACLVFKCAPYATCETTVHDTICTCIPGYTGDGKIACNLSKNFLNALLNCIANDYFYSSTY